MANILLRLIDRIGEGTMSGAERAYRRAAEMSIAVKEQDAAARAMMNRVKGEDAERKKTMEDKLSKIKEAVSTEIEPGEELPSFELERDELKEAFSTRLANIISDLFSGYTKGPSSFFKNIQEDLYRANIMMPASKYIALSLGVSVITGVVSGIVLGILLTTLIGASGALLGVVLALPIGLFTLMFTKIYPKSKVAGRSDSFSRELPFALRHMSTQLTSGSGLLETMRSVSQSDYGVLSEEFRRAILEIERGATIEEAYERMTLRVESAGLKKAARQIISTLRTGGNLANTLKVIGEEVSMEMRMKLKDFIQILNTFSMIYMFVVVVAPVLITTLVIAMGIAMKGLVLGPDIMWMLYMAFFGIAVYMSIMIKKFEPKA